MTRLTRRSPRLAPTAALALLLAASQAHAVSSASSEVSGSVSTSVGKSSDSIGKSSDSSSKGKKDVAEGDYRVVEVAEVAGKPGFFRLTLAPTEGLPADAGFDLLVPQEAVARAGARAGLLVSATLRPYGVEFAAGEARKPFFLALHDEWHRELNSRPVTL